MERGGGGGGRFIQRYRGSQSLLAPALTASTGILSHLGAKLRDWAIGRQRPDATLWQRCPQMTPRPGSPVVPVHAYS